MKKLSLLLITAFVSVIGYGAIDPNTGWVHPNPFVYNMKSEISKDGTKVLLSYSLNGNSFNWDDQYNLLNPKDGTGTARGIQIYLLHKDSEGNWQRVKKDGNVWAITSGKYVKGDWTVEVKVSDIPAEYHNQELCWEAIVHGNMGRTEPGQVLAYNQAITGTPTQDASSTSKGYPRNVHGIAIEKEPAHPHFGKVLITEACNTSVPKNSMLEYDIHLRYQGFQHKDYLVSKEGTATSHFSATVDYEPHRVRVSEDGRVFVTCYHPTASHAVLEYMGNNTFKSIVKCDQGANQDLSSAPIAKHNRYYRRPIAMDVKGSGDDLTILVAWINPKGKLVNAAGEETTNTTDSYWLAQVECYEYKVGKDGIDIGQDQGTLVAVFTDHQVLNPDAGADNNHKYSGALFLSYLDDRTGSKYGFVGVSYDKDGDVWMKVDYDQDETSTDNRGQILFFKQGGQLTPDYTYTMTPNTDATIKRYGGNGIKVIEMKGGTQKLFTGRSSDQFEMFAIDKNASEILQSAGIFSQNGESSSIIVDFAEDYAGNLYILNSRGNHTNADNVVVFALPYSGSRTTRAQETFKVSNHPNNKPVPNILATELKCVPMVNKDYYTFSFKTNTKPTVAEIRFYKKENLNKMNVNINTIHASTYDKYKNTTVAPDYVYRFTEAGTANSTPLKAGLMSVKLRMVGGEADAEGQIINEALPPGEMYWSVYVETHKSSDFADYYRSGYSTDTKYHPLHATVNNYPATDLFGALFVTNNPSYSGATRPDVGLVAYELSENNGSYERTYEYLNGNTLSLNYPRRMAVAPDGKVFIADEGQDGGVSNVENVTIKVGGVKVWDPTTGKITLFSDNALNTSTGLALYNHNNTWKLYAANTYNEFYVHGGNLHYTNENKNGKYGGNGFVEHTINSTWTGYSGSYVQRSLKRGDASGNISVVAMEHGVWLCQNRDHTRDVKDITKEALADNLDAYILSFVPYGSNTRTWYSCTSNGVNDTDPNRPEYTDISKFSQTRTAPVQATPGAGLAYQKICVGKDGAGNDKYEEYLYIVNHDGNIAKIKINGWSGSGSSIKPNIDIHNETAIKNQVTIIPISDDLKETMEVIAYKSGGQNTTWRTAYIMSMDFDYAGNLVTVIGGAKKSGAMSHSNNSKHQVVIFTMPYNRTNAQEIRASDSQYYIPERISQTYDEHINVIEPYITNGHPKYNTAVGLDVYRPMMKGSFNTICLPFSMTAEQIAQSPYAGATIMRYAGASYRTQDGEGMVDFNFEPVTAITAGEPYLIQLPETSVIRGIVRFEPDVAVKLSTNQPANKPMQAIAGTDAPQNSQATYQGIIDMKTWSADDIDLFPIFLLTDNNRLGEVRTYGDMYGLRGYFRTTNIPTSAKYNISSRKPATTGLVDHKGRPVDVEKFVREGRAYIRVGETLYTLDGQKVGR